ncbi:MAG TPA: PASTA domain-containing protein [Thermoanaerobaculia bacterium]
MVPRPVRILGFVAYLALVVVVFGLAAYVSFSLFVRSGATRTPALEGLPIQEARQVLRDQGLELRVEDDGRFHDRIPAEHVVQQHPGEGDLVKRGSPVVVVPSLGPQRIPVPELHGQGLQSAQVLLAAAGLALGRTVEVFSPDEDPGMVVAQEPAAGETVAPGSVVDLLLAREGSAEAFVMPDLVYREYDPVRLFFESREFRLGSVKYERYEGIRPGVILRQYPPAGHPLGRGDTIALVVAAEARELPAALPGGFPGTLPGEPPANDPFGDAPTE